jgi:hypothetical protein
VQTSLRREDSLWCGHLVSRASKKLSLEGLNEVSGPAQVFALECSSHFGESIFTLGDSLFVGCLLVSCVVRSLKDSVEFLHLLTYLLIYTYSLTLLPTSCLLR